MAMVVHRELGCGFLEAAYHEAPGIEFTSRKIPFKREVVLLINYKNTKLSTSYRADFICRNSVIVGLKALSQLGENEEAQVINYLKASGLVAGLLINFATGALEYKRFVFTNNKISEKSADRA